MSKPQDLSVSDVASELRIRRKGATALVESGALVGYDASPPGAKRKSYRVTRKDLDEFKAGRSAKQTKPTRRRFVAKPAADFVEYFT